MSRRRRPYRRSVHSAREVYEWVKTKLREDPDTPTVAVNQMLDTVFNENLRESAINKIRADIRRDLQTTKETSADKTPKKNQKLDLFKIYDDYGIGISPISLDKVPVELAGVADYEGPEELEDISEPPPKDPPREDLEKSSIPLQDKHKTASENIHSVLELLLEAVPDLVELHFEKGKPVKYKLLDEGELDF